MARFECEVCGYIYDPEKGEPEYDIEPGTEFEELPDDWLCPLCSMDKSAFVEADD